MRRVLRGAFLNIMKKYYPSYYDKFSCLAGECPDSCCRKWEIVIDDETYSEYNIINTEFGRKIRSHIIEDGEGEHCFKLKDGSCPFLNSDGLCDIHIELGEEFTSEICRNHPRFIEEYDGFTEISLSLSCPEANRIILSDSEAFYPVPDYSGDDEVLSLLISSRECLLNSKVDALTLIKHLLDTAADDSLDIDLVYINEHPVFDIDFLKGFGSFLSEKCEILTDVWKTYLRTVLESYVTNKAFASFCNDNDILLRKILRYYIYRYYLKAVNDLDIYSRALMIASACLFSAFVAFSCSLPLAEAARLFSKEAEHNLYNLDMLLSYFSEF